MKFNSTLTLIITVFTQAVNIALGNLSSNTILFHSGANNELITGSILDRAEIQFGLGSPDNPQPHYKNSDADIVPNIAGFNGNVVQWIKSIIAVPDLSKGPEISPHTLPLGYIVEPTRYSGPYTEEGAP